MITLRYNSNLWEFPGGLLVKFWAYTAGETKV